MAALPTPSAESPMVYGQGQDQVDDDVVLVVAQVPSGSVEKAGCWETSKHCFWKIVNWCRRFLFSPYCTALRVAVVSMILEGSAISALGNIEPAALQPCNRDVGCIYQTSRNGVLNSTNGHFASIRNGEEESFTVEDFVDGPSSLRAWLTGIRWPDVPGRQLPAICPDTTREEMQALCASVETKEKFDGVHYSRISSVLVIICACTVAHDWGILYSGSEWSLVGVGSAGLILVFLHFFLAILVTFWALSLSGVFVVSLDEQRGCACYYQLEGVQALLALSVPGVVLSQALTRFDTWMEEAIFGNALYFQPHRIPHHVEKQCRSWRSGNLMEWDFNGLEPPVLGHGSSWTPSPRTCMVFWLMILLVIVWVVTIYTALPEVRQEFRDGELDGPGKLLCAMLFATIGTICVSFGALCLYLPVRAFMLPPAALPDVRGQVWRVENRAACYFFVCLFAILVLAPYAFYYRAKHFLHVYATMEGDGAACTPERFREFCTSHPGLVRSIQWMRGLQDELGEFLITGLGEVVSEDAGITASKPNADGTAETKEEALGEIASNLSPSDEKQTAAATEQAQHESRKDSSPCDAGHTSQTHAEEDETTRKAQQCTTPREDEEEAAALTREVRWLQRLEKHRNDFLRERTPAVQRDSE
ncbi:unnamed protein product [Symbiodinium sp. CCMP2592]|nr:unnamed protein product [Symbiodinium sp. CCMP2592]